MIAPVQKKIHKISTWRLDDDNDDNGDTNNDKDNDYFATPNKRNNNAGKRMHKKSKTVINSDLVLGAEFGNEGTANMDNEEGEDNDNGPMGEPPKKYGMTEAKDWTILVEGGSCPIKPGRYTGDFELFGLKLADVDLHKMHNDFGAICFHKLFE